MHMAAAHAAMVNAAKAMGTIVRLAPPEFLKILAKDDQPLVVTGTGGIFRKKHQYLVNYRGIFFFTQSDSPLSLPYKAEVVAATTIWVPSM